MQHAWGLHPSAALARNRPGRRVPMVFRPTMVPGLSQVAFVSSPPQVARASPSLPAATGGTRGTHASPALAASACLASAVPISLRLGRKTGRRTKGYRVQRLAAAAADVPVDRERYTDAAWQAMQDAPQIAQRCQSQYVDPEHVFLACLEQQISTTGGLCARILEKVGISQQVAKDRVTEPWSHRAHLLLDAAIVLDLLMLSDVCTVCILKIFKSIPWVQVQASFRLGACARVSKDWSNKQPKVHAASRCKPWWDQLYSVVRTPQMPQRSPKFIYYVWGHTGLTEGTVAAGGPIVVLCAVPLFVLCASPACRSRRPGVPWVTLQEGASSQWFLKQMQLLGKQRSG